MRNEEGKISVRIVYLCWKYKIGMSDKTLNIKGNTHVALYPGSDRDSECYPLILFYAGSRKQTEADIEERIQAILSEGGQIIDVGGYSSRPDAEEVSPEEEMERLAFCLKDIERTLSGGCRIGRYISC